MFIFALTNISRKITVLWDLTTCSLVEVSEEHSVSVSLCCRIALNTEAAYFSEKYTRLHDVTSSQSCRENFKFRKRASCIILMPITDKLTELKV